MPLFNPDPQVVEGKVKRLIDQLKIQRLKVAALEIEKDDLKTHVARLDVDMENLWNVVFRNQVNYQPRRADEDHPEVKAMYSYRKL